uniref:ERCC4 domain-containing protein n=1 Tax=viral metagenome TaxID=1070528 RepID=A0A6C0JL30_9ZZZZ
MFIKVDSREKDLQSKLSYYISSIPAFRNLKVITESLPIGDVIISGNNNEDILIIERKSIIDLLSSIKDGRYEEQSYRLNGTPLHNHNIMYVIEGDVNKMNMFRETKFEKLTLYSAIFSLNYYKGFSVIRTFTLDETALFVCNCTSKLMKGEATERKAFYANKSVIPVSVIDVITEKAEADSTGNEDSDEHPEHSEESEQSNNASSKEYIGLVKKVKKENITPENIDEIMLCQIPGVSTATAISIIKKFNNISNLIKCLEENEKCLNDVTNINNKGQSRKITKTSIANIIKFLLKK